MPSLTEYFRNVFSLEDKVMAKVKAIVDQLTIAEFLEDAAAAGDLIKEALLRALMEDAQEAERIGRSFGASIGPLRVGSSTAAVQAGISQLERAVNSAVDEFMLRVTRQIEAQLGNGVVSPTVSPALFDVLQRKLIEAAPNAVQSITNQTVITSIAEGDMEPWTWITVHDSRVCPDCEVRHRVTKPLRDWVQMGLPKSGFSVCGDRDRCILLPEAYADDSVDLSAPVRMTRADALKFGERVEDLVGA